MSDMKVNGKSVALWLEDEKWEGQNAYLQYWQGVREDRPDLLGDTGRFVGWVKEVGHYAPLPDAPINAPRCRVFEPAPTPKPRQRVQFDHGPQHLHDAHVAVYMLALIDSEFGNVDAHSGNEVRPEHWRCVRAADTGDDTGQYERDCRGEPPKGITSCLHRLPDRVTPSRILSQAQRAKVSYLRATFGIREVIEAKVQTKRRGRPSKATMQARARAGI